MIKKIFKFQAWLNTISFNWGVRNKEYIIYLIKQFKTILKYLFIITIIIFRVMFIFILFSMLRMAIIEQNNKIILMIFALGILETLYYLVYFSFKLLAEQD